MRTTDVSQIWNALGSFWGDFEDKALIEQLWQSYFTVVSGLERKSQNIRDSISFKNMPAVIEDRHQSYDIIYAVNTPSYSGLINAYLVSGKYEFDITPGTFSIPKMTYYCYTDSGTLESPTPLVEDREYSIVGMNRIRFIDDPPFSVNQNQEHFKGQKLFADVCYRVNPVLWSIGPRLIGATENILINEDYPAPSGSTTYDNVEHFKYFVWAVSEGLKRDPTITNIENLLGIVAGLPFAYSSGVGVNQFDVQGENKVEVLDYINSLSTITGLVDNQAQIYNYVRINVPTGTTYNSGLFSTIVDAYLPSHLTYDISYI